MSDKTRPRAITFMGRTYADTGVSVGVSNSHPRVVAVDALLAEEQTAADVLDAYCPLPGGSTITLGAAWEDATRAAINAVTGKRDST